MGTVYSELPNELVSAANGIDYAYRDTGGGEGAVPLVLLQHFRGNLDNWDPALIDALARAAGRDVRQTRRTRALISTAVAETIPAMAFAPRSTFSARNCQNEEASRVAHRTAVRGCGQAYTTCNWRPGADRLAGVAWPGGAVGNALSGGASDVGGDDVGGVPVQGCPGPVVAHSGPRVGVRCRFLDVAQRHARVQRGSDESVPQGVRPDRLSDPGAAGDPTDDPPCAAPVHPAAVRGEEDRSCAALTDSQVDGPRGARRQRGW
jgi:hypothetical protein